MIDGSNTLFVFVCAWALACVGTVWTRCRGRRFSTGSTDTDRGTPRVAVIVPCRGGGPVVRGFLETLAAQHYRHFTIYWCIESGDQGAAEAFRTSACQDMGRIIESTVATSCSQKNSNLLAGIAAAEHESVLVFADADTLLPENWLDMILAILEKTDIVSGYRIQLPFHNRLSLGFIAACDWGVAAMPQPRWIGIRHLWGGTIGMSRETWTRLAAKHELARSFNDDLLLSDLADQVRLRIALPSPLLLTSPLDGDWRSGLAFARRQFFATRLYSRSLYRLAILLFTTGLAAWATAVLTFVGTGQLGSLAVLYGAAGIKTLLKLRHNLTVGRSIEVRRLFSTLTWMILAEPLLLAGQLVLLLSAWPTEHITWADRIYRVSTPSNVRVVSRTGSSLGTRS